MKNRQNLYNLFLQAYNACSKRLIFSLNELILTQESEPWVASEGKEQEMGRLKELWCELNLVELCYTDEASYQAGLNAVRRKLLLVGA